MPRRLIILLCLTAFSGLAADRPAGRAQAQEATPVDNRFGAVEAFWAPEEAADLGVGWERILFYWNEIQPTGPEDWNTLHVLEEWLVDANGHGRTVVGLLKNTPAWATDGEVFAGVPRGLYLPIDSPNNLWAGYVRRVAAYYAPRGVHNWIIWNEPDISPGTYGHEFAGSVHDYYQMVKVAYRVMKEVDPAAEIHLAGLTYWHDPAYLRRFFQVVAADPEAAANDNFFDVISLHVYFRVETVGIIVSNIWALQNEFGLSKPVWINETNAPPNQDPQWPVERPQFQVDLEQQGWFLVQAHALGFGAGAQRIAVYKLLDVHLPAGGESFGLVRPDFSRRPAYDAYQTMVRYLGGFTWPVHREQYPDYFSVLFTRPEGATRVLWARHGAAMTIQTPATADTALLVNVDGRASLVAAQGGVFTIRLEGARCYEDDCLIGGPPVYLVEGGNLPAAPTATPITGLAGAGVTFPITMTVTEIPPTMPPTLTPRPSVTPAATALPSDTPRPALDLPPTPVVTPSPAGFELALAATETAEPAAVSPDQSSGRGRPAIAPVPIALLFLSAGIGLGLVLLFLARLRARPG